MVVCPGAATFAQALEWTAEVYRAAGALMAEAGRLKGVADEGGYWPDFATNEEALEMLVRAIERAGLAPGEQVAIALDVAASEFGRGGRYRLGLDGRELDSAGMIALLLGWLERYPIVSIEDPLAEDDPDGFAAFTRAVGGRCQVVADDLTVTDAARVRAAAELKAANTLLIKPNQRGTLTETRAAWDAARAAGWGGIVSARSGETEDTTIVHLAIGWGVPQLKVGSFARSERMAKWNEALRIEEALGADAQLARPFARADLRPEPCASGGLPRIEQARPCPSEVPGIARHQGQIVNQGGRSDQPIDCRQLRLSCKITPAGGLGVADDQDALGEKLTQAAQPARQPISARRIALAALHDAFGDFLNGEHTHEVGVRTGSLEPAHHVRLRPSPTGLRDHVGVQEVAHRSISRPRSFGRSISKSSTFGPPSR